MELTRCLVMLSLIVLPLAVDGTLLGDWKPIKDVKDPRVVEIAKFAVVEHNKQAGQDLKLDHVVGGETQVVSGTNYKLVVATSDGKTYEAILWDNPRAHYRKLTSFKPAQ